MNRIAHRVVALGVFVGIVSGCSFEQWDNFVEGYNESFVEGYNSAPQLYTPAPVYTPTTYDPPPVSSGPSSGMVTPCGGGDPVPAPPPGEVVVCPR